MGGVPEEVKTVLQDPADFHRKWLMVFKSHGFMWDHSSGTNGH